MLDLITNGSGAGLSAPQTDSPDSPAPHLNHADLMRPDLSDILQPQNLFSVHGLVVVVTGGGTGIGLQMAIALEHNGAIVYIIGRRLDVIELAASKNNRYGNIIPLQGDVTSRESLLEVVAAVEKRHGYIDLLINNAGIARNLLSHPLPAPPPSSPPSKFVPSIKEFQSALWDTGTPDDFAESFTCNVTAVYYTTVAFLELLHAGNIRQQESPSVRPARTSHVLTVSSSGAFRLDAQILSVSYTLAKAASTHLGKLLANLLAPWGVRSNVLAPGVWPSEMAPESILTPEYLARTVPVGRAGEQEDMAGTLLFLASRAGAYVNGAVWLLDGGRIGGVASSYGYGM